MTADSPALAPLLRSFFLDRLIRQRNVSSATIASYRDTFRLLLRFAEEHLHRSAGSLTTEDLGAPLVLAFLDHLEHKRGNSVRTRNARLAAVHSFARHAGREEPTALVQVQRVLAIPPRRFARPILGHLSRDEVHALLDAPDRSTWSGRRDAVLLAMIYNTGARVSEALGLDIAGLHLDRTPHRLEGAEAAVRSLAAHARSRQASERQHRGARARAARIHLVDRPRGREESRLIQTTHNIGQGDSRDGG